MNRRHCWLPVNLLPVDPAAEAAGTQPRTAAAAPPVRLAPEITAAKEPATDSAAHAGERIEPASFQELTPGKTTREQVVAKLGEPAGVTEQDGIETLRFVVGPFPTVRVSLQNDRVSSIVVHLAAPSTRQDIAKELGLEAFRPAIVQDGQQRPLGEVYPERGLMFAYADGAADERTALIEHVILETISVEPFLLRAQQPPWEHLAARLADLRTAQELAPDNAVAFALTADLQLECGRPLMALAAAQKAVELDAASAAYQVTLANAHRQLGQAKEATDVLRAVMQKSDLSPLDHARARNLYGRLLATTEPRDYKRAMEETVSAIKLAAGATERAAGTDRQQLRQTLIDAELSLAEILAYGPWKQKHQVVPQWLATAEKSAGELVQKDHGSRIALLSVYNTTLHCLLALDGQGSPDKVADAALQLGREIISQVEDDEFHAVVEWRLGTGQWLAAQIAHRQGQGPKALQFANNADALMASAAKTRVEARNDASPESTSVPDGVDLRVLSEG